MPYIIILVVILMLIIAISLPARIETEIIINASREEVYKKIINFESFSSYSPFIQNIKGKAIKGETLTVELGLKGEEPFTIKPKVIRIDENKLFCWKGKVGLGYIFDGVHCFEVQNIDENSVKFMHYETFRGLLVWPMNHKVIPPTKDKFKLHNIAFKKVCEA